MDEIYTVKTDEVFPLLSQLHDTPNELFVRGILPSSPLHFLCVVGSRTYSDYGKAVVEKLFNGLRGYPICIVSGLALGIDSIAHESALSNDLYTIAVPGSGLSREVLYPRRNMGLARRIVDAGGALISEFEPHFRAQLWSFPKRNRIMAGLSNATLIVEASEKSGTLITARLALEYGREVCTVPGSIFSKQSAGPHSLIRDGATPITSSADLLEALGIEQKEAQAQSELSSLSSAERAVLLWIENEPMPKDALIRALQMPAHDASVLFSMMELKGLLKESGGLLYPFQ